MLAIGSSASRPEKRVRHLPVALQDGVFLELSMSVLLALAHFKRSHDLLLLLKVVSLHKKLWPLAFNQVHH